MTMKFIPVHCELCMFGICRGIAIAEDQWTALAVALHDAATLAIRAATANVLMITTVPRGAEASRSHVNITAYTEICFQLRDKDAEIAALRAQLAALSNAHGPVAALKEALARGLVTPQQAEMEIMQCLDEWYRAHPLPQQMYRLDDEPEFGPEILEAADR